MLNPIKLANKNFLSSLDISSEELFYILDIAKNFKNKALNIELKDNEGEDSFSMIPLFSTQTENEFKRDFTIHHSIDGSFAISLEEIPFSLVKNSDVPRYSIYWWNKDDTNPYASMMDLLNLVAGKHVQIVGPAPYMIGQKKGKHLDSVDVVVRLNEIIPFVTILSLAFLIRNLVSNNEFVSMRNLGFSILFLNSSLTLPSTPP